MWIMYVFHINIRRKCNTVGVCNNFSYFSQQYDTQHGLYFLAG